MVELYGAFYAHDRTTATTYINDKIVVCVLENILTETEDVLVADGAHREVIDGRVAFQTKTEDEFTAAIELLTHRRVVALLSANQTTPRRGVRALLPRRRTDRRAWETVVDQQSLGAACGQ